jgi:hypothetical protein
MRVRIVCGEPVHQWILGKFAIKLEYYLKEMGVDVDISDTPDPLADVNHYIIYIQYKGIASNGINTLMITHIDNSQKLSLLKKQLNTVEMGICMSGDTRDFLINNDLPANKLNFISPAHDEIISPRKRVIGVTCRVQDDGRKREFLLKDIGNAIDNKLFCFKIMGDGWDMYVDFLRNNGFDVEYHDAFNYQLYTELIPTFDYYLYMGMDEGQMGCIDAIAAGVDAIVTHQGYHIEMLEGIKYTFKTKQELIDIFKLIQTGLKQKIDVVKYWTWPFYAEKHLELWKYLIAIKNNTVLTVQPKDYVDGIFSIGGSSTVFKTNASQKVKSNLQLKLNYLSHTYLSSKKTVQNLLKTKGIIGAAKYLWVKSIAKLTK